MINRDSKCVFVTDKPGHADVVVVFLGEHGIPARVMDRNTLGGFEGLTPWSISGVSARGIEVWVVDDAHGTEAVKLLEEHQLLEADKVDRQGDAGPVDAVCEECGAASRFPGALRGSVQQCSHCGAFVDVADDESEWVDSFGEEEPEDEAK